MKDYWCEVNDCCGLFDYTEHDDFEGALESYKALRSKYHGSRSYHVQIINYDRVDLGCPDGLTEDEHSRLEEVAA